MDCTNCGKTVPADVDFCPFCGEAARAPEASRQPAPAPAVATPTPAQPPAPQPAAGARTLPWSMCLLVGCLVGVIVLAVVGVGGYFAWQRAREHVTPPSDVSGAPTPDPVTPTPEPPTTEPGSLSPFPTTLSDLEHNERAMAVVRALCQPPMDDPSFGGMELGAYGEGQDGWFVDSAKDLGGGYVSAGVSEWAGSGFVAVLRREGAGDRFLFGVQDTPSVEQLRGVGISPGDYRDYLLGEVGDWPWDDGDQVQTW